MSFTQSPTTRTSIEQKLKAKNCALQLKNGSPKLRDLLREVRFFFVILNSFLALFLRLKEVSYANEGVKSGGVWFFTKYSTRKKGGSKKSSFRLIQFSLQNKLLAYQCYCTWGTTTWNRRYRASWHHRKGNNW